MPRSFLLLVCGLALGSGVRQGSATHDDSQASAINLLFVANEGVLIATDTKKVLIDALFTDPNPEYEAPPPEMLANIESGHAPFDGIDLALVTHDHPDHFSARFAASFLENNPTTVLMAPGDAIAALRDSAADWARIQSRAFAINLQAGETTDRTVRGVTVRAYRTLHSGGRESPENLMYLIEMDDRTIFHEGDSDGASETFASFGLAEENIDLALVHFWFPLDADAEGIIMGILKPKHVGLFHLPIRLKEDAPRTVEAVSGNYDDIFLLTSPGERLSFR